jgi:hypothetical protein
MWLAIGAVLSHVGGWARLGTHFRARERGTGERFRFVSGSIGANTFPVNYRCCLFVAVNDIGFYLSILFLFRLFSPPLFLPWPAVESVEEKRRLFFRYVVVRLRDHWPAISIAGRAGQCIKAAYEAASHD